MVVRLLRRNTAPKLVTKRTKRRKKFYFSSKTKKVSCVLLDDKRYRTAIAKWKRKQQNNDPWKNQDMVNNVLIEFKRHLKWGGIEPTAQLAIHTLRKSCCQNWANHLPINVTKELMGHSSIATTQKFYSQVDDDHRAKAAAVINDLVSDIGDEDSGVKKSDAEVTPEAILGQNHANEQG
jgi:integrase